MNGKRERSVTFYRQARVDGGVRTGLSIDGNTQWETFRPGKQIEDPSLLWYVDVRCRGANLPATPPEARRWLLRHAESIKSALNDVPRKVQFDDQLQPFEKHIQIDGGVDVGVFISAVRGASSEVVAKQVRLVRQNWESLLEQLAPATN